MITMKVASTSTRTLFSWRTTAAALLLALAACEPVPGPGQPVPRVVQRPGISPPSFRQLAQAGCSLSGDPEEFAQCMRQQGYSQTQSAPLPVSEPLSSNSIGTMFKDCNQFLYYTHDPAEVMRLAREVDAYPEVDVAYPFDTAARAGNYSECLAAARGNIGILYFSGRGFRQDYAEAAKWFTKALSVRPESSCWIAKLSQHQAD